MSSADELGEEASGLRATGQSDVIMPKAGERTFDARNLTLGP